MVSFSENESFVLMSMMMNPEHGDKERAASLNMNLFTFNKIKNNLIREGMIKRELVPNYGLLGFEIMLASFGTRLMPFLSNEIKESLGNSILGQAPTHLIFFLSEPGQGLGFHAVEDFTSMKNGFIRAERRIFDSLNMGRGDMTVVPFSFRDMKIGKMFDLLTLIRRNFACEVEIPKLDPGTPGQEVSCMPWPEYFRMGASGKTLDLNDEEWSLLVQLVSYPDRSDKFHSERSHLSRYRLRKIRDRLFSERAIKPLVIPNPVSIGLGVLIFSHLTFKPSIDAVEMYESGEWRMPPNLILTLIDRQDAIGIGLYRGLAEGMEAQSDLLSIMGHMNILEGSPHSQIFSLEDSLGSWPISFESPLVQKGNWNLDKEFMRWLASISSGAP